MLREGLHVDLLVFHTDGPRCDEVPAGARIIDLAGKGGLSLIVALGRYIRATPSLRGMIVSNVLLAPHVGLAARLFRRPHLPILCVQHGDLRRYSINSTGFGAAARRWLTVKAGFLLSVRLAAVSDGTRHSVAETLKISPMKVEVMGNPIVLATPGDSIPGDMLEWWKASGNISLLGVGRMTPIKGFESLIEAVDLLREQAEVRLVIVGSGPHQSVLERLVEGRGLSGYVRFAGYVPQPRKYYEEADVFILASKTEAFALSLVEAMSVGTQVVATDCDHGPCEILDGGRFGRLVPVGDPIALKDGVLATIEDPVDSKSLLMRASEYSTKKILERYLKQLRLDYLLQWEQR